MTNSVCNYSSAASHFQVILNHGFIPKAHESEAYGDALLPFQTWANESEFDCQDFSSYASEGPAPLVCITLNMLVTDRHAKLQAS